MLSCTQETEIKMSEFEPHTPPQEAFAQQTEVLRIHDKEIAHLGALVMDAAMRPDLGTVAADHVERTGVSSPNSYAPNQLRIGEQVVPESSENVYRQVTQAGVEDLADSGVVRGAYSAGKRAKTSSHTTYWNTGEDGKGSTLGQGFVIEAPKEAAENGWVTADQVTGVYAKDSDGQVKNIIA